MRSIKFYLILLFAICTFAVNAQTPQGYPANYANGPRFKALVYYTQHAEEAHYQFSLQAVEFFKKLNYGDGFVLDITMDLSQYSYEQLKEYSVVVMLDGYPNTKAERDAFEKYMENGGGWVGFHVAAYNDKHTNWPWLKLTMKNTPSPEIYPFLLWLRQVSGINGIPVREPIKT